MKRIIILCILFCALVSLTKSQNVKGIVRSVDTKGKKETLFGANVYWATTITGTTSGEKGEFEIPWLGDSLNRLVISYVGFVNDTITVPGYTKYIEVMLKESVELEGITVTGRDNAFSMIKPINAEIIGEKELKKAACCNLAESFESNASVDVVYPDAVSGARTIQMLGLSGVYTQLLTENAPLTRGLAANYGLSFIPGPWIESIQITKGVGSVVNGYESMSGQINLEYLKPEADKTENLFVNLYGNAMGRGEANIHFNKKFNDTLSTLLFVHGNTYVTKNDHNHDNFLDNPLSKQINIMNRWKRQTRKTEQVFMVRALQDEKTGGQLNYNPATDYNTTNAYGIGIKTQLVEGLIKNGFLFPSSATRSMGIIASGKYHAYDSYFGLRNYTAEQNSGYLNWIFQDVFSTTLHNYKTGLSFVYDRFKENYNDSVFGRTETVPGAFFEYSYVNEKFTGMAGVRGDYHNLYGFKFSPRVHFRYSVKDRTTFRASAGTGFRTPNIFIENASVMASSRAVDIREELLPEESVNAGGSITHRFMMFGNEANFNADYYYTQFISQVVVDLDSDVDKVSFYNLDGRSFSHSAQFDIDMMLYKGLTVKAAYKNYFVRSTYLGIEMDKPMVPKHRVMFNTSYHTPSKKWKFDYISNWFGVSRVPSTAQNPAAFQFPAKSKEYYIIHFQVTKLFKHFEAYAGVENLLNFTQHDAIIDYQNPFGSNFDAALVWGPLNGRNFYAGIRYSLRR